MDSAAKLLWRYVDDDTATTAIEYSLIASGVALAIVPVMLVISSNMEDMYNYFLGQLRDAGSQD